MLFSSPIAFIFLASFNAIAARPCFVDYIRNDLDTTFYVSSGTLGKAIGALSDELETVIRNVQIHPSRLLAGEFRPMPMTSIQDGPCTVEIERTVTNITVKQFRMPSISYSVQPPDSIKLAVKGGSFTACVQDILVNKACGRRMHDTREICVSSSATDQMDIEITLSLNIVNGRLNVEMGNSYRVHFPLTSQYRRESSDPPPNFDAGTRDLDPGVDAYVTYMETTDWEWEKQSKVCALIQKALADIRKQMPASDMKLGGIGTQYQICSVEVFRDVFEIAISGGINITTVEA